MSTAEGLKPILKDMELSVKVSKLYKTTCAPLPEMFRGPQIDTLRYKVYPDANAAYSALKEGEIDLLDWPLLSGEEESDELRLESCQLFGYWYLGLNTRVSPTNNKAMRKALAFLFDSARRKVASTLRADQVELMDGMMVKYYGRLVNPYLPKYDTKDEADAVQKARAVLSDFVMEEARIIDPAGSEIAENSIKCLVAEDDQMARALMMAFKEILDKFPQLSRAFSFISSTRNDVSSQIYSDEDSDWGLYVGFTHVQDNLSRWNPGMCKLRLSLDWMADYQSKNSATRNAVGFSDDSYDLYAEQFLKTLTPHDLRGAVITEYHLDPSWNNPQFWEDGGDVPLESSALLLLWKLQAILADEVPVVPLIMPSVKFVSRSDVEGIFNGNPGETFTYPGGTSPIPSTYPGGTLSYWTFQRVHKRGEKAGTISVGVSNQLSHLNPLGIGNYWEALIWSRIYESLLGLNPFLLMKGVAEDNVHLTKLFSSELLDDKLIQQRLHFELRENLFWHDGVPFDAYDVAFTFLSLLGTEGRLIAQRHPSTEDLTNSLVNERPVPAWVDLVRSLHHIEVKDDLTVDVHLKMHSRYSHEWFGDVPIIPMHVWKFLGSDFTKPVYNGQQGLYRIGDYTKIQPKGDFTGWNGMVGLGPFMWTFEGEGATNEDPLTEGGSLRAYKRYHNS